MTPSASAGRDPLPKHTILFLASNPSGTDRRALDQEASSIRKELRRSGYRIGSSS